MKKAKIIFKVPDSFKVGDCQNCPLSSEYYFDNHYVVSKRGCILKFPTTFCPIEVEVMENDY